MKNLVITLICLLLVTSVRAQKKKVGYYNEDSLLRLIPGYEKCLDSARINRDTVNATIARLENEKAKKSREADSCSKTDSPLIKKLRNEQLRQLENQLAEYKYLSEIECHTLDSTRKAPYLVKFNAAKSAAEAEYNCSISLTENIARTKYKPEEVEFIDLNKAIAEKLR